MGISIRLFFVFLFALSSSLSSQVFYQKPPLGTQLNLSHPLSKDLTAWIFNEGSGGILYGFGSGSEIDRTLIINSTVTWEVRGNTNSGGGLFFDNTNDAQELVVPASFGGFWTDPITEMTIFVVATLEVDDVGPMLIWETGDFTDGIVVGYRNGPNTYVFKVTQTGETAVEIQSSSTFVPTSNVALCARFDNGAMELFVNSVSEGTTTAGNDSILITTGGGIGAGGDGEDAFGTSSSAMGNEWGGMISLVFVSHQAWPDDEIFAFFSEYYRMFGNPLYVRIPADVVVPAGTPATPKKGRPRFWGIMDNADKLYGDIIIEIPHEIYYIQNY